VTISGRSQPAVENAVTSLAARYSPDRVFGYPCDVSDFSQVQTLWDAARAHFGRVDIWINNAGIAHTTIPTWEQSPETIRSVVETNVIGAVYGARVALKGLIEQGGGQLYNMEGYGSDGSIRSGMLLTLYGSSKSLIHYFSRSLAMEVRNQPVQVGWIRPGMVATEMISRQYDGRIEDWERLKRIFNIIAERVEVVAPWIARKILENKRNGAQIQYGGAFRLLLRFLLAPFVKRDVMGDLRPGQSG
jgi:NAD(P)-dependent dehydrogenase (short-subunit alcohol dehydrogenase family)